MKRILPLFVFWACCFGWQASAQFNEGFEGGAIPTGWTQQYDSETVDWIVGDFNGDDSVTPRTGDYMAVFIDDSYDPVTKLVTPGLDLTTLSNPQLTFYYTNVSWLGDVDELRVYYKANISDPWVQIGSDYVNSQSSWTEVVLDLPNPSADYYIAFEGSSNYGYGLTLDDVSIDNGPSCVSPTDVQVNNITTTTADVVWTTGGSETDWEIVVQPAGTGEPTANGTGTAVNSHTVVNLSPCFQYEVYVRADCSAGELSDWSGPFNFVTPGVAVSSFPWSEDFETVTEPNLPDCWSQIDNNDDGDNWQTYASYGVGDSNAAGLYTDYNSGDNDDYLVLPPFALTGNERLKFSVRARSSAEPNDYRVVLSTTGTDASDFDTELMPLTTASSTTHQEINPIDLSSYTGDVYIAIHVPNGGLDGWYIYFDDFVVEDIPSCVELTDLAVTNIGTTSADLSWTADSSQTNWNVEVVEAGAAPTGNGTATTTNPHTVSNLQASTEYDFYVQADCNGDLSTWSGPFTFLTECVAIDTFPWTEDFEGISVPNLPICWSQINNNDDGDYWETYDSYGVGGSNAAGLYTDYNSGDNDDYLILPAFALTGNERLKFNVRARSSGEPNDYRVVLSTTGTDPSDFDTELMPLTTVSTTTHQEIDPINLSSYTGNIYIAIHVPNGGLDGWYIYFDDFVVEDLPSCVEPSALIASNITDTSVDVIWTAGGTEAEWEIIYGESGFDPENEGTTVLDNDGAIGEQLTGLASETAYDFYVKSICGASDESSWAGPGNFITGVSEVIVSVDNPVLNETFCYESDQTKEWLYVSSDGAPINISFHDGTVEDSWDGSTYDDLVIYDGMDDSGIELFNSDNDGYAFTGLSFTASSGSIYMTLSSDSSVSCASGSETPLDFDVEVEVSSLCAAPSGLNVGGQTETSAELSWTAEGDEVEWEILYGEIGFDPDNEGTVIVDDDGSLGETVTALVADTDYEFYVRAICDANNTSDWIGPHAFSALSPDACGQEQVSNDFENGFFIESGGQEIANDFIISANTNNFSLEDITVNILSQGGIASMDVIFYEDNNGMPGVEIESETGIVPSSQDIIGDAFGYDVHEVVIQLPNEIDFMGNGTTEVTYWMQLIGYPTVSGTQLAWETTTVNTIGEFNVYDNDDIDGTIWVGGDADGVFTLNGVCSYIDCPSPEGLTVENLTMTSADLSWNEIGAATEWQVVYGLADFDPLTEGTVVDDNDGVLGESITGLSVDTDYEFYVFSYCEAGEESSLAGPYSFFTGYCASVPTSSDGTGISTIEVGTAQYTSGGDLTYEDFTDTTVNLAQGINTNIEIEFGHTLGYDTHVWIDYNDDLNFDASELMFSGESTGGTPNTIDASFLMPLNAPMGTHRMRIVTTDFVQNPPDPCYNGSWGVTSDFTVDIVEAPDCLAPSNISITNIGMDEATIGWDTFDNAVGYNYVLVYEGQDPDDPNPLDNGTTSTTEIDFTNLTADTAYEVFVQSDCDADGDSLWASISFFTGYCASQPSNLDGNGIATVEISTTTFTSDGANVYEDFTNTPVDLPQGIEANVEIDFDHNFTYDTNVWIDFNNDFVFDDTELVFSGESTGDTPNAIDASFMMPIDAPLGTYRMRIGTADSGQATPDPCYNGFWGVTADFTVNVIAAPNCLAPSNVDITELLTSSVTMEWDAFTGATDYEYIVLYEGQDPNNDPALFTGTTTGTEVTIPGLNSGTGYEFYIWSNCSGAETSAMIDIAFSTPIACGDNFYDSGGVSGNYGNNEDQTWTFAPDSPTEFVQLNFSMVNVESCCDVLTIYDGADTNAPILESDLETPGVFTSSAPGGSLTVTFTSDGSVTPAGWEATILCVSCIAPSNLVATNILIDGTTLSWDDSASAIDGYTWVIVEQGDDPEVPGDVVETGTTMSSTVDVTGLSSGTIYEAYVSADCGTVDGISPWSQAETFTTAYGCNNDFYDTGGPNGNYGNNENQTWTIYPDSPSEFVQINFTMVNVEACCDVLSVYDGSDVSAPALELDIENPGVFASSTPGGALTITFTSDGSVTPAGWEATIECVTCIAPVNIEASSILMDGATLTWDDSASAIDGYTWVIVEQGDDPDVPGDIVETGTTMSSSVDISGLSSGTIYEAYVSADCGATDGTSPWSQAETFTTAYGCDNNFYDTGGPTGNYGNSESQTWTIYPNDPSEYVQINFTMVNVESCCDVLSVYDGGDTTAPVLVNDLETPGVFTSGAPGEPLTVTFTSDGSVALAGWEAIIECVTCIAPVNVQIEELFADGATVAWDALDDALDGYEWVIVSAGGDPEDGDQVISSGTTTNNEITVDSLDPSTDYEVYLMSNCGTVNGMSGFSPALPFSTLCQAPTGLNITAEGYEEVAFSWDPVPEAIGYEYIIVESGMDHTNPDNHVGIGTIGSGTQSSLIVEYLEMGVPYDLYLRIICDVDYYGEWDSESFETMAIDKNTLEGFSYYPNPVKNELNLQSIENIEVVEVYNMLGQIVKTERPNSLNSVIDMSNFQAGAYVVRVTVGATTGTYRILKE